MPKTRSTHARCETCVHNREYDPATVTPPGPVYFCEALTEAVLAWIRAHEFSWKGMPIGKVTTPCPGYAGRGDAAGE